MKIFNVIFVLFTSTYSFSIQSQQYTAPSFELIQREKVDLDQNIDNTRGNFSIEEGERSPSSSKNARHEANEVEHWKIQEIIDRYDEH